ncbi:hypothetical protein T552_02695 [Pneumocystis carinii B80]|uniref:Protein MAK16 n=1 Tax=Pneumocystis carinii (strain B80) TaxID=1408658 RepID=A0A0W4ZE82_PNEC8|nr:hypothetical protein T552_02695 [Pneumocystis carinii B80]KTW26688.1 hypothetical protein T552_02695 [Pneumocystis carinii B80]
MDDIIWQVINQNFCSYKVKANTQNFCKNEYNVTGICNRQSCPLANSQYATIKEKKGILYLYMKTIERSHMPSKMWEKVKLSKNYIKALKQIDEKLLYWPNFLIYKNKARLTRLTQYLIKSKRLLLKKRPELVAIKPKEIRRETARERKALQIAKLENSIEKKLIERLKSGIYGENPLNVSEDIWKKILGSQKSQQENESELEYENIEEQTEFFSDNEESDLEESYRKYKFEDDDYDLTDNSDMSDSDMSEESYDSIKESDTEKNEIKEIFQKRKHKSQQLRKNKKAKAYIEIEYEQENQLTDKKV